MGDDMTNTIETLQAVVKHPNAGGVLVLALGCENNQLEPFKASLTDYDKDRVLFLKAQDVEDEVEEGTKLCMSLYQKMINDKREEAPLSTITIGLKCGGSDGFSGISANPLVGEMSDFIVANGGSTLLTEVPEMFGAEQVLMHRAKDEETFNKIVSLINNFKKYYSDHNQVCYENPSPGNKQGGITTLEDKSLGCTQKAGLSKVVDVLHLGDEIKHKGLNLLKGPGNDMIACSNLACAGAHIILFTTGRGTPFGTFVPTMKIATNTPLSIKKSNWIDFNAGQIVDGKESKSTFIYDKYGRLTEEKNRCNHYFYTYDLKNKCVTMKEADNVENVYLYYDERGNLVKSLWRGSGSESVCLNTYNEKNQLVESKTNDTKVERYKYNNNGDLIEIVNQHYERSKYWEYDENHKIVFEISCKNCDELYYEYDSVGNITGKYYIDDDGGKSYTDVYVYEYY